MFDVAIIGIGCAGYTAAIYAARYKLSTIIVGAEEGGMGMTAAEVGNWPGIQEIRGPDLMKSFKDHALSLGTEQKIAYIDRIEKTDAGFRLHPRSGDPIEARTVIFATGSKKRHLGAPGEEEFSGKGVTYCATCDAFFYRGKDVAVVGGGDSAVEGAAIAAQVARKVYLVHRRAEFRAEPYWVDKVKERGNVEFILERSITEIMGDGKVTGIRLNEAHEGRDVLDVDGVFIEIGADPASDLARASGCAIDERGFIKVDAGMRTNVEGLFAAGDVTDASNYFAQFVTAAGEAAVAANSAFNYLQVTEKPIQIPSP